MELEKDSALVAGLRQVTGISSSKHRSIKENLIEKLLLAFTLLSSILIFFIIFFVISKGFPVLKASGISFLTTGGWDYTIYKMSSSRIYWEEYSYFCGPGLSEQIPFAAK